MTEAGPSHNCCGVRLFVYLLIRHKLGKKGKYIETVRGIGYKFEVK